MASQKTFQNVRGTRDFFPKEMNSRKALFDSLKKTAQTYGFNEIEAPAIEDFELIKAKSGEEIKEQMFMIEKKGKEQMALRAELTPSVARMFISTQKEIPKPVKWYYLTRMWRYEAPQKGRLREFYQFGVELFGSDKIESDVEVISLAISTLISLGLKKEDFVIRINNRQLIQAFLESIGITDIEQTLRNIDKKQKLNEEEFNSLFSYLDNKQLNKINTFLSLNNLGKMEEFLKDSSSDVKNALKDIKSLFALIDAIGYNGYIEFGPDVARGLAYYTGIVFECFDRKGDFRAILGGGRYDNMISQFGGQPCPATGFAMGDAVLELFLRSKGLWKEDNKGVDYYVAPVNEDYKKKAFEIVDSIRKSGSSADIDVMSKKLGKQFSYANSIGAKKVVIVGEETEDGNVKVKDMVSGDEEEIQIDNLCK